MPAQQAGDWPPRGAGIRPVCAGCAAQESMRALRLLQAENALKRKCIAENARRWVGRPLTEKHARVDDGDVTTQRCYAGLAADDRLGTTGGSCLPAMASPAIACTPSLLELTVPLTGPSFSALDGGHRDGAVSAADPPSAPFPFKFTTAAQATTSPALGSCPVQPRTVVSPASVHRSFRTVRRRHAGAGAQKWRALVARRTALRS